MKKDSYNKYKTVWDILLRSNIAWIRNYALNMVYDETFYEEPHQKKAQSAAIVAEIILRNLTFKNVFDIGCGIGLFISEMAKKGVEAIGCDYSESAIANSCTNVTIFKADASKRIVVNRKFDLVICFEVAEHLADKHSNQLVDSCVRHSDSVLFTAAPPGQGGVGHINEQPYEYWIQKFENSGFMHDNELSMKLQSEMRTQNVVSWLADNIMFFKRKV